MNSTPENNRRYSRFDTELKVHFQVKYDFKTKVRFQVVQSPHDGIGAHKYAGICKDISVEGLSFTSHKQTYQGDIVSLEVYPPNAKKPVKMEGEVRWSRKLPDGPEGKEIFQSGVLLVKANNKPVDETIYFDSEYQVMWSEVLGCLFGNFKTLAKQLQKNLKRKNKP
jgi:hypothetical protein